MINKNTMLIVGLLVAAIESQAATYYVSPSGSDANNGTTWALAKQTIQSGINVAVNGDTVLVTNGAYMLTSQISISQGVTVRSVNGAEATTINGGGVTRCAHVYTNAVLDGFTVTNGYSSRNYGGGVYVDSGTIQNCSISGNSAYYGGGVFADGATIQNCLISGNSATYSGGGVSASNSTVQNCSISENYVVLSGGGISASGSTVQDCSISGNIVFWGIGGGLYTSYGTIVQNCSISGNSIRCLGFYPLRTYGGGVYVEGGTVQNCSISGNTGGSGGVYASGYGTVENCTISGNWGIFGGGVLLSFGTVQDCSISGNTASYGGGVENRDGTIQNCSISGNYASCHGGGVYVFRGTVQDCSISGNYAGFGGGVVVNGGTVRNCTISGNRAVSGGISSGWGGGVSFWYGTVENCAISGNTAYQGGGGMLWDGTVQNCTISGNSATNSGGGVYIYTSGCPYIDYGTLQNCAISGNTAYDGGGVIVGRGTVENCTISENMASNSGGGLYGNNGTVRNCVAYYNQNGDASGAISYSCIGTNIAGVGNITNEPQFVSFGTGYGTNHVPGDYRLKPTSPCINAGTNQSWMTNSIDLDGLPRVLDSVVDMGAYECVGTNSAIMRNPTILSNRCDYGSIATGQTIEVWNAGTGPMEYGLSPNVNWLSLSPASGTSTGETDIVSVIYGSAGLTPGTYTGTVTITSAEAINSPQVVTVYLRVDKPGTVQFSSSSYSVNEDAGTVTLTVTRTGGISGSASVEFATADGTASAGTDYTSKSGTLSWSDGDTASKTITVFITDDSIDENNETFTVTLRNAVGAGLGSPSVATVTIVDNDNPPAGNIRFAETNVVVNEDVVNVELKVVRTNGCYGVVSVDYTDSGVTASAGVDYGVVTGRLTWADGDASDKVITIPVVDDSADEPDEVFEVVLTNAAGTSISGTNVASVTIVDNDDPPAGVIQFAITSTEVSEAGGSVTLSVVRTGGSYGSASVDYATANNTASAGTDYTSRSGTLSWSDGDTASKTITVSVTDDSIDENNETFTVTLRNAIGAGLGSPSSATVTILDNDDPPAGEIRFAETNYVVSEGATNAVVSVVRTGGCYGVVSVDYTDSGVTASAGVDYGVVTGRLTWADGDASEKVITIPIVDDSVVESNEVFEVVLTNAAGTSISGTNVASVTIVDNDEPPAGEIQFAVTSIEVGEAGGSVTLSVVRTGGSYGSASVDYATADGTASAGTDYTSRSGKLSWSDGDTASKTITVSVTDDSIDENDETFRVVLQNAQGATLGSNDTATVTIVDNDDNPGAVQFSASIYSVDEDAGTVTLTVTRTGGSYGPATVDYTIADGTASAGSDYTSQSGTLSWSDGDTADKTITISITDDSLEEDDETFTVLLSNASGVSLGSTSSAMVTIVDNDELGDADIEVSDLKFVPVNLWAGDHPAMISFDLANEGPEDLVSPDAQIEISFFLSSNTTFGDEDDIAIGTTIEDILLSAGTQTTIRDPGRAHNIDITIPEGLSGDFYVFVSVQLLSQSGLSDPDGAYAMRDGPIRVRIHPSDTDYDGDGISDLAVYHEESGFWYILLSASGEVTFQQFGALGYCPVPGDYDGDGISDMAVFDSNTGYWYIRSLNAELGTGNGELIAWAVEWGWPGAIPVWGDYDADGVSDLAVFDSNTGYWYIRSLNGELIAWAVGWGWPGAVPVSGDYDGDGLSDIAVFDSNTGYWYVYSLSGSVIAWAQQWGWPGAVPVSGDFDGDGKADLTVYHETSGYWYILLSESITLSYQKLGGPGYEPVPGDYDGDGKTDLAVYHESSGYWYVGSSMATTKSSFQFGGPGYTPVGVMR